MYRESFSCGRHAARLSITGILGFVVAVHAYFGGFVWGAALGLAVCLASAGAHFRAVQHGYNYWSRASLFFYIGGVTSSLALVALLLRGVGE